MSGAGRDGQRRGVQESPRPATPRDHGPCRYSYSAVCGFVTVARLRQIPAAQSGRSMTPAVASRDCAHWVKAAFAAAIQRLRHPGR